MQGLYEIHETGWEIPGYVGDTPLSEVVISDVGPQNEGADEHVDTSVIPGEDSRDASELPVAPGGGDKKPPFGSSGSHTTFEEPEENGEQPQDDEVAVSLGAVASDVTLQDESLQEVPEGLEVWAEGDATLVVNRNHPESALIEHAVEQLNNDGPWYGVPISTARERTYWKDSEQDPKLFVKVTDAIDEPDGISEIALASEVTGIIASDQAQQIVQNHGFASIAYVEPLAVLDQPDQQTTIYPWQDGTHPINDDSLSSSEQLVQLEKLHDLAQDLRGLMGANGVNPADLDSLQLLVSEDNRLSLLDIEDYQRFEPAPATLAQGEAIHHTRAGQHDISAAKPSHMDINEGDFLVGRREADNAGIEVGATIQDGHAVAIWNTHTGESAFFSVRTPAEAQAQIAGVTRDVPSLTGWETVAHLIGPARISLQDGMRYSLARELEKALGVSDYISHVSEKHSQLSIVNATGENKIVFNTGDGALQVINEQGRPVYSFVAPTAISRNADE